MVKKFTIPFASQGDANDIPDALQVDGKVSFTQGFGYDYERPYDDPQAKDIAREDMNGLFKAITSAVGELQALGASEWSNAISYPKGAIVYFEKDLYISQVDDNQNTPPQNWVSITSIANDSLKKVANLADLTNKATARNNLGLGSSATLNKTDTLGTSSNLVATQKLVNDTKINLDNSVRAVDNKAGKAQSSANTAQSTANTAVTKADNAQSRADSAYNLANSKQDKLTFTGTGNVARMGEVEKKRDKSDNNFNGSLYIEDNYRTKVYTNPKNSVFTIQLDSGERFYFEGNGGHIATKQNTAALGSVQYTDWNSIVAAGWGEWSSENRASASYSKIARSHVPADSVLTGKYDLRTEDGGSIRIQYRRIIRTGN